MRLRVFLTLLMAFTNLISSVSLAQMQWGYGAYGGMQACQGMSMASGASDEEDESAELRQERYDLRKEKRQLEKDFRGIEADMGKARDAISGVVQSSWSDLIIEHMDNKFNCGLCETRRMTTTTTVIRVAPPVDERPPQIPTRPMPVAAPPRDTTDRTTVQELPAPAPVPVKPPKPVRAPPKGQRPAEQPQIKPGQIDPNASIVTPNNSRMPAATEVPAKVSAQFSTSSERPRVAPVEESLGPGDVLMEAPVDKWGSDKDFSSGGWASDGSPTLCRDRVEPYTLKKWSAICRRDGGRIERLVCTHRGFQKGAKLAPKEVNDCAKSVDRYPKLVADMEKKQARLAQIDIEIDRIGDELKDLKVAERENRAMEADCPDGRCAEGSRGRRRESRGPTLGQAFLSMMPSLLGAGAVYAVGKDANKRNERTGNMATPLAPYVAQALMGYPYGVAGQYGGTYGGVNGAFGCSPSVGGMQMGPNGMMMMPGMNPYGQVGGAFGYPQAMMQGYPMGGAMYNPGAGPWGVNGPWGVGAWPGGYPGNGVLAGQFAGALAAFPGGIPYPGAYPGAYPGQIPGYNPNAAFAGQLASFPGQIPGMPYPGAYPGYPQYPGQYPGQIPGQIPGMYPGAFPGQYQGQYPGLYPGGYPQTGFAGMPDPNLVNRQIEQQRSELMRYQSFIQEYSSFTSKWQQYFGGGAGGGTTTYRNDYYYTQPSGPTTNTGTGRTR